MRCICGGEKEHRRPPCTPGHPRDETRDGCLGTTGDVSSCPEKASARSRWPLAGSPTEHLEEENDAVATRSDRGALRIRRLALPELDRCLAAARRLGIPSLTPLGAPSAPC